MYPDTATIEVYHDGQWQPAATVRIRDESQGYRGWCELEYRLEYTGRYAGPAETRRTGVSCRYPVDFAINQEDRWPPFLLDVLPSGYGRQQWLDHLDIRDGPAADWPLLMRGTAFPPGNLRIAEAVAAKDLARPVPTASGELAPMNKHPGFTRAEILERNEHFVEYVFQHGIYAAGASDVQGVAPKLLLTQDLHGRWHAEGVLRDDQVTACWLVKRPRGRTEADRKVLKNEAAYMAVAQQLGLNVFSPLAWERDTLFIPRFDRIITPGKSVARLGMESLCSLAGVTDYGAPLFHDRLCQAIKDYCTDPGSDLIEYIKRDILNVVLGNKDNHARNTVVLRRDNGTVALSPLFDFAPMYLDPEGIARVCRWEGDAETAGTPEWAKVLERLEADLPRGKAALREFGKHIEALPDVLRQAGVDDDIIEHRHHAIGDHARQLQAL